MITQKQQNALDAITAAYKELDRVLKSNKKFITQELIPKVKKLELDFSRKHITGLKNTRTKQSKSGKISGAGLR